MYRLRVRYAYVVDGVRRTSSLRCAAEVGGVTSWGSRQAAERDAVRYPGGAPVTVFHDPADPTRAVLKTGPRRSDWAAFAVAVAFCSLTPFLLWFCLVLLSPERLG